MPSNDQPTLKPWLLPNGQKWSEFDTYGDYIPGRCARCPCTVKTCDQKKDDWKNAILEITDPVTGEPEWEVKENWDMSYTPATYTYNSIMGTWEISTPASGQIRMVLTDDPMTYNTYFTMLSVCIMENKTSGEQRIAGCFCDYPVTLRGKVFQPYFQEVNTHNRSWWVATYPLEPHRDNPCGFTICNRIVAYMYSWQRKIGGEIIGEGYIEYDTNPTDSSDYFRYAWTFTHPINQTRECLTIDCNCTEIREPYDFNLVDVYGNWRFYARSLTGICTSTKCAAAVFALINSAKVAGLRYWHEGVLFPRDGQATGYEDPDNPGVYILDGWEWGKHYDPLNRISTLCSSQSDARDGWPVCRFLAAKRNYDGTFTYIGCCDPNDPEYEPDEMLFNLEQYQIGIVTIPMPSDNKDIALLIEVPNACDCIDLRKIVYEHSEDFGIVQMTEGSNAIYTIEGEGNKKAYNAYSGGTVPAGYVDIGIPIKHVCFKGGNTYGSGEASFLDVHALVVTKNYEFRNRPVVGVGFCQWEIAMLTPSPIGSNELIQWRISQTFIRNAITSCAITDGARILLDGILFTPYTYCAWLDGYYYAYNEFGGYGGDFFYDPDDSDAEFPWYCDVGGNSIIYKEDDPRQIIGVLRPYINNGAWWQPQGYICGREQFDMPCTCGHNNGYGPPLNWGNPWGHVGAMESLVWYATYGILTEALVSQTATGDAVLWYSMDYAKGSGYSGPDWYDNVLFAHDCNGSLIGICTANNKPSRVCNAKDDNASGSAGLALMDREAMEQYDDNSTSEVMA